MFEKASRLKIRFPYKGNCSVEDLWDLPLKDLDIIFRTLNTKKKMENEESLLLVKTQEDEILDLQISIIRKVFNTRMQEKQAQENKAALAAEKQKLMGLIAKKQDQELESLTIEELTAKINQLSV